MAQHPEDSPLLSPDRAHYVVGILVGAAIAWGLYRSINLAWVGDDLFISLRYAQQFLDGHGLVFNPGERVEGYTNFLWTMILAGGMRIGIDPVWFSKFLGVLSYVAIAGMFLVLSYRLWRDDSRMTVLLPLTAVGILLMRDFQVWATSGLETSWTTMLVSLGFVLLVTARRFRTVGLAGVALALAALSRPDALLFYVMAAPYVLLVGEGRIKRLAVFLAPLALLYVPYWIWRFSYYGYPFPNTYYAKSAYLTWYSQGLMYLWLFVKTYYVFLLVPAGAVVILITVVREWLQARTLPGLAHRAGLLALLFAAPYVVYVVRTGGDFMFARFFIPIVPFLFFMLEYPLHVLRMGVVARVAVVLVVLGATVFYQDQFPGDNRVIEGIVDERDYYPAKFVERSRRQGLQMREYFKHSDETVAFYGAKAMLVYYAQPDTALEANTGLTDEWLAHQEVRQRTRPGHEKLAPYEYLVERDVNFVLRPTYRIRPGHDTLRMASLGNHGAYILIYENRVMDSLAQFDDVSFINMPEALDRYIATMERFSPTKVRQDFQFFDHYYFQHNEDPQRRQAFLNYLNTSR